IARRAKSARLTSYATRSTTANGGPSEAKGRSSHARVQPRTALGGIVTGALTSTPRCRCRTVPDTVVRQTPMATPGGDGREAGKGRDMTAALWRNWSGTETARPVRVERPSTVEELRDAV